MKTEEIILNNFTLAYPLSKIAPLKDILFVDIETTGFLSTGSIIYLIGCAYYENENWCIKQFFANSPEEEMQILSAFFDFAAKYKFLIHFNGNNFDLPFISKRAEFFNLENLLVSMKGMDIYKRILTYKNLLKLSDCKLKTIERFLDINREDVYSGGELIQVYNDYVSSRDYELYHTLLLHNSDDMKGMLDILPIISYYDLFNSKLTAVKVSASYYKDINGFNHEELVIGVSFANKLPKPVSFMGQGCHFRAEGNNGTLIVPMYNEELKYYYANYKDYYYLPLEDTALHKSIASFVDKEYREQATAHTCYTRKIGTFLPQWSVMIEPFFKRDYDSTDLFFELTDDIKHDREVFSKYVSHVINKIAFQK